MLLQAKILAALVVLGLCPAYGQEQSPLAFFQSFFDEGIPSPPVEVALQKATTRLHEAIEMNDPRATAQALKGLGLLHLTRTHDYGLAMDFLIRSLSIEDSLKMKDELILTYISMAKVFEVVGDYPKSAQFLDQALKINDTKRDINILVMILNHLGKVNASMGNAAEAFENYELVLDYKDEIDDRVQAEALFNLGHLYTQQGKYSEALQSHKKALAITRAIRDRRTEALTLNDIGEVYRLMKNDGKSLANHLVALEIRQSLNDKRGIAQSYNNIGLLYHKQKDTERAIANVWLALEHGREAQAQEEMFKSYELLSQAYKDLGDYKNALTYKELSLAISEFMQNERHERQLLETQNRYVLEKKENQIEKLEELRIARDKEIEEQKKSKNLLILLTSLILIIMLLVLYLYLVKRRTNRTLQVASDKVQQQNIKLQQLNSTKDKFFSIVSHDLKGPLNSLTSFSHLLIDHTDSMSREEIQMLAKDLDKSVKNLYALLENLLEWSRSQTGNIDFAPEVFDFSEILEMNKSLLASQAQTKNIGIVIAGNPKCMVKIHRHSINTVVRNLISNAIKFTNEGGIVTLNVQPEGNHIVVSVTDTGVGMDQEAINKLFRLDKKHSSTGTANEKGTGLGLILCKEFVEKNGGRMQVKSEPGKGSVFSFSFPQHLSGTVVLPPTKTASFI